MSLQNTVDSVRGLVSDGILLLQQELQLARAEAGEKLDNLRHGVLYLIVGLMLGVCGVLILAQALIILLAAILGPFAPVIVALIFLGFTAFFLMRGSALMKSKNLMPHRTVASVNRTAETIRENV